MFNLVGYLGSTMYMKKFSLFYIILSMSHHSSMILIKYINFYF